MIKTLSISKARAALPTLVGDAQNKLDEYVITVNGSPAAVLVSADFYDSLKETLEVVSDSELMREIKEAEKEIEDGNYVTWEEFKKEFLQDV